MRGRQHRAARPVGPLTVLSLICCEPASADQGEIQQLANAMAAVFNRVIADDAGADMIQDHIAALGTDPDSVSQLSVSAQAEIARMTEQLALVVGQQVEYINQAHQTLVAAIAASKQAGAERRDPPVCGDSDERCIDAANFNPADNTRATKILQPFSAPQVGYSPISEEFSTLVFAPGVDKGAAAVRSDAATTSGLDQVWSTNHENSRRMDRQEYMAGATLWQYFGSQAGYMRMYPGVKSQVGNFGPGYDHRERGWYAASASTGKNVVVVVDKSGSMGRGGVPNRWEVAKQAVDTVLKTLSVRDWISVIFFDSDSDANNANHIFDCFKGQLVRATPQNIGRIRNWVGLPGGIPCASCSNTRITPDKGTNFKAALERAFATFAMSADADGCGNMILFMTDGQDDSFDPAVVQELRTQTEKKVVIFSYALGSEVDEHIGKPLRVACDNDGVFTKVADVSQGGDLKKQMGQFYQYFAQEDPLNPSAVMWSAPYTDAGGLGLVVSITRPVYDTTGAFPVFYGVLAADVQVANLMGLLRTSSGLYSYSFVTDGYGQVLMHPALADPNDPRYTEGSQDYYYIDIWSIETSDAFRGLSNEFLNVQEGDPYLGETVQIEREIPSGSMSDFEGISTRTIDATYNFMRVGDFRICLVLGEADKSRIKFQFPASLPRPLDESSRSYYHRIDLGRCDLSICSSETCCDGKREAPPRVGSLAQLTQSGWRTKTRGGALSSTKEFDVYESGYDAAARKAGPNTKSVVFTAASSFDASAEWTSLTSYYRKPHSRPGQSYVSPTTPGFGPNGETDAHVLEMQNYINLNGSLSGQRLKQNVRELIYFTQPLESWWLKSYIDSSTGQPKPDYFGMYIGLEVGVWRSIPGRNTWYAFEPTGRPWYLRAKANILSTTLSTPYMDLQTNDVVMTISKTVMMPCGQDEQSCVTRANGGAISRNNVLGVVGFDYMYTDFVSNLRSLPGPCQGDTPGELCVLLDGAGMVIAIVSADIPGLETDTRDIYSRGNVFIADDGTNRYVGGNVTFNAHMKDIAAELTSKGILKQHTMHDWVADKVYNYFKLDPPEDFTALDFSGACSTGRATGGLARVGDGSNGTGTSVYLLSLKNYFPDSTAPSCRQLGGQGLSSNPRPYQQRIDVCISDSGRYTHHRAAAGVCREVTVTPQALSYMRRNAERVNGPDCCEDVATCSGLVNTTSGGSGPSRSVAAAALSAALPVAASLVAMTA